MPAPSRTHSIIGQLLLALGLPPAVKGAYIAASRDPTPLHVATGPLHQASDTRTAVAVERWRDVGVSGFLWGRDALRPRVSQPTIHDPKSSGGAAEHG